MLSEQRNDVCKIGQVKEEGGGGKGRKLPLSLTLFPFLALVPFFARSKAEIPFLGLFCFVLKPHGDAWYAGFLGARLFEGYAFSQAALIAVVVFSSFC